MFINKDEILVKGLLSTIGVLLVCSFAVAFITTLEFMTEPFPRDMKKAAAAGQQQIRHGVERAKR